MTKTILILAIAAVFVAGSIMTGTMAEAKKDKSEGNDNNPFKALWDAIADLQSQIANLTFVQDDLDEPVLELQVDPNSNAPALVVSDGTDDLFLVNEDGSIQIGSNTVVIRPDGKITAGGQPLVVQGSVGQTSSLQEWKTSDGTSVGTINPSGVLTANSFVGDGSGLTGLPRSIITYVEKNSEIIPPIFHAQVQAQCDVGDIALGGGGFIGNNGELQGSGPLNSEGIFAFDDEVAIGWQIIGDAGSSLSSTFFVWVICYDNSPLRNLGPPIVVIP